MYAWHTLFKHMYVCMDIDIHFFTVAPQGSLPRATPLGESSPNSWLHRGAIGVKFLAQGNNNSRTGATEHWTWDLAVTRPMLKPQDCCCLHAYVYYMCSMHTQTHAYIQVYMCASTHILTIKKCTNIMLVLFFWRFLKFLL